jgi:hypothetical protein
MRQVRRFRSPRRASRRAALRELTRSSPGRHRPGVPPFSTVRMADLILVLRDGSLCEQGSHAELMAAAGLYAELLELQARAYR